MEFHQLMSLTLYWSYTEQKLVKALTSKVAVTSIAAVLRDVQPVTIYLVTPQSSQATPYVAGEIADIGAGLHIEYGAKGALTDATYLSQQQTWTETGSTYYVGDFPLDGASLISAMSGITSKTLYAEFTIVDGAGKNYLSTQFNLVISHDVIQGTEP